MPITSQATFLSLVARYHEDPSKFVFFVGAGLSQPLFPAWGSLLRRFVKAASVSGLPYSEEEMLSYIDSGENFLEIADACVTAMGPSSYRDIMESIFDIEINESLIPKAYKELINLAPKTIITTNYDRVPDVAGRGKFRVNTNKTSSEAIRSIAEGRTVVFKMHGDIVDHSSLVLTTSDYQRIIYTDQATRQLLNSVFSSKYLIFIGFSMSDPHLKDILEKINAVTNIPLSHYLLLNESSQFKIASLEKKYGLKVISYSPSDDSHPEVLEFLRALKHDSTESNIKNPEAKEISITDKDKLLEYMDTEISARHVGGKYSVYTSDSILILSFTPTGQTNAEIQTELLTLLRIMNFNCNLISSIQFLIIINTPPSSNIGETQKCILKARIEFSSAQKFARHEISTSSLWSQLAFFSPGSIVDPFEVEQRVAYPMNVGLIGE